MMLTKLVEISEAGRRKPKADQYWPELDQENLIFPRSGLRVEQLPHRRLDQESYKHREGC